MAETLVRRERDGERVLWRKTYTDRRNPRRLPLAMLRGVARALDAPPLRPPPLLAAEDACRTEQAMIRRLSALGMRVPEIVDAGPRHLLLSDLGGTLAGACAHEPDCGRRRHLVSLGLDALARLHARGGWLSQAFARNMTLADGVVGFIDLEEDPTVVMSHQAAMARDVLFYVHSTARYLGDQPGTYAGLLSGHLQREDVLVRHKVLRVARRLGWVAPVARRLGGRARGIADAIESLRHAA